MQQTYLNFGDLKNKSISRFSMSGLSTRVDNDFSLNVAIFDHVVGFM